MKLTDRIKQGLFKIGETVAKPLISAGILPEEGKFKNKRQKEQQQQKRQTQSVAPVQRKVEPPQPKISTPKIDLTKSKIEAPTVSFEIPDFEETIQTDFTFDTMNELQRIRSKYKTRTELSNEEKNQLIRELYRAGARRGDTSDWYNEMDELEIKKEEQVDAKSQVLDDELANLENRYNLI